MFVTLLNPPPLGQVEQHVGAVAGVCYDSKNPDNAKRVKHLVEQTHLSCFRHMSITVQVEGISIPCARQLFRHVHTVQDENEPTWDGVLERSMRYVDACGVDFIIPPEIMKQESLLAACVEYAWRSKSLYEMLRQNGIKKGDARYFLPQAMATKVIVTANIEAWFAFCKLRTAKDAQWEIRDLAFKIVELITPHSPTLFNSFDWGLHHD